MLNPTYNISLVVAIVNTFNHLFIFIYYLLPGSTNTIIIKDLTIDWGTIINRKQITPSQKKAQYSKKLFARLTNAAPGEKTSIMDKLIRNIDRDLESLDPEVLKVATDGVFKLLPYVMPRESNGSGVNVQINNTANGKNGTTQTIVLGFAEFSQKRLAQIADVEKRRRIKLNEDIELKEIGVINKKDGK